MSEFNNELNTYYVPEQQADPGRQPVYTSQPDYVQQPVYTEAAPTRQRPGSAHFFSLPARIGLWFVGIIAGVTIVFGCGLLWIWGLNYLGVIDTEKAAAPQTNEFNGSGDDYSEFEEFYDYFDDFFGSNPGGSEDNSGTAEGTPGIGVTIQEVILDFTIENKYNAGLVIIEISENGALVGTEAQVGDLIVAVNGAACPNIDTLDAQLKATGIGGQMVLTLARYTNGVASTFDVTITLIDMSAVD